jgi:hypothetical protein
LRRAWEAEGASKTLILTKTALSDGTIQLCSFLDLYTKTGKDRKDEVAPTKILEDSFEGYKYRQHDVDGFQSWLSPCPNDKWYSSNIMFASCCGIIAFHGEMYR